MVSIRDSNILKYHIRALKTIYNFDLASLIVLIISWVAWDYFLQHIKLHKWFS